MILTCPECATRYFVEQDALPASGRTVRCAACGSSWRALPETAAAEPPLQLAAAGATLAAAPASAAGAAPVSKAFRARVEERRRTREAVAAGVAWAAVSAAVVVVVLAGVLFRVEVVRVWPRAAGVYALLRLPVNPTGLALDAVQGQPGLADGRMVMTVTGLERNVEARPRPASPLRVTLYDKAGARAAVQLVRPQAGDVQPGEARGFRATFVDPPISATEVGVEFAFDAPPPPPSARTIHGEGGGAPAPAAVVREARPLPADSPYALPPAAHD